MTAMDKRISEIGVVPVIKLNNPERDAAPLAKALCEGGVPVAEVTFRAPRAEVAIKAMREACPDMLVGAGTVLTKEQVDLSIEAGAQFIVLPGFDPELVSYCQEKNIPIYPGCTTASEYHTALKYNLSVLKFFPAEQSGGLAKIKAMSAPFPMFKVMPTGGINLKNLKDYLSCPVIAACGGSWMVPSDKIAAGDFDAIREMTAEAVALVKEIRK